MAQSDLNDMVVVRTDDATEATDQLVGFGESVNDVANKAKAAQVGVLNAAYIRYDVALDNYAARDDIEDLAHKNARDIPSDFKDASFMRTVSGNAGSGSSA